MPVGPYKTFGDCVAAQRRKGNSGESSRKICGQIEQNTVQALRRRAETSSVKYEDNGHLFIKAFLLSADLNINQWGISPDSLHKYINTFIGKPLVLTDNFKHPLPPEGNRVGSNEQYDDDKDPNNVVNVDDIVDHWLEYQEAFRIGSIIDVVEKKGTYYAIIEVTSPAAKEAFRNNDVPLFVSPAIAQLDPYDDPTNISNWTGIHLAIVSDPAYTIKKAIVSGQCHDEKDRCLLQLRQAAIERKVFPKTGCGFCRTKVLRKYSNIVHQYITQSENYNIEMPLIRWANTENEFLELETPDSSRKFSDTKSKLLELTEDNTQQVKTTEEKSKEVAATTETKTPPSSSSSTIEIEATTKTAAEEFGIKLAGMEECVQIFTQNGVAPDQSMQICKLAAKALMENQQQQQQQPGAGGGRNTSNNGPGISGQFGSTVSDYEKEIARQEVKIGQLTEELKNYKKGDKTDAQRIAELEDQLSGVKSALKEKELEAYLVTKIADEDLRTKKIKRFAELNMTIEDLKDIYETSTDPKIATKGAAPRTAEVATATTAAPTTQTSPISRVKLQVAGTTDTPKEDTKSVSEIRERNLRIVSSLLQKDGLR